MSKRSNRGITGESAVLGRASPSVALAEWERMESNNPGSSHAVQLAVERQVAPVVLEPNGVAHRFLAQVDSITAWIIGFALLTELTVLFGSIVTRFFGHPLLWSQEIGLLSLTVLTFSGGALAYWRDEQMAVQAFVAWLPPFWQNVARALADWSVVVMAVVVCPLAAQEVQISWNDVTQVLGISTGWYLVPVSLGMLLLLLFALGRLWYQPRKTVLLTGILAFAVTALIAASFQSAGPSSSNPAVLLLTFGVFGLQMLIGVPIGFVLTTAAALFLHSSGTATLLVIPLHLTSGISSFVLLAVPFFMLAGAVMTEGGLSLPLAEFVRCLVGRIRGGLLQVIVVTMYIFSGLSGSKVADVAAVGSTMKDMLKQNGYDPAETTAVLAASAVMGETIPPSIAMLVLGSITTLPMGALFMAGLLPAGVIAVWIMALIYIRARHFNVRKAEKYTLGETCRITLRAIPALLVPAFLVGGIVSGLATPTEISSTAVIYAILIGVFGYKAINGHGLWKIIRGSAVKAGTILFIIAAGGAFSWTLTIATIPHKIAALFQYLGHSSSLFMLATVFTLIVMGAILEGLPALLVFGPLLLPLAPVFGVDQLQYGIVLIIAMGLGSFSPPIGLCIYVCCSVTGTTMEEAAPRMLPYIIVVILGLLAVAFIPWFSLVLPRLLHLI